MPSIFTSPQHSNSPADWLRRNILTPSSGTTVILPSPVKSHALVRRPSLRKLNERRNSFKKSRTASEPTVPTEQVYSIPGVGSAEDFLARGSEYAMASEQAGVPLPSPGKVRSLAKRQVMHEYADLRAQRDARRATKPRRKSVLRRLPSLQTIGEHPGSPGILGRLDTLASLAEHDTKECEGSDSPVPGIDTQAWLDETTSEAPISFLDSDSDDEWVAQRPEPDAGPLNSHPVHPEEVAKILYSAPAKHLIRPGTPEVFGLESSESSSACSSDASSETIVVDERSLTPLSANSFSSTSVEPSQSLPVSPYDIPASTTITAVSEPVSRASPEPEPTLERAASEPIKINVEPPTPTAPKHGAHVLRHMDAMFDAGKACINRRRSSAAKKDLEEAASAARQSIDSITSITSSNYEGDEADEVELDPLRNVGIPFGRDSTIGLAM